MSEVLLKGVLTDCPEGAMRGPRFSSFWVFFTEIPDYKPYDAYAADKRIFDPQKALDPFDEKFDWKAVKDSPQIDNVQDMFHESKEQDKYRLENREKNK